MRTTISKVNDIRNNEIRTYEKIKPDVKLLRGITTVELFNANTGEKSYEVETENFVTTLVDDARENWSRYAYVCSTITNNTSSSYGYISLNNSGEFLKTSHYNTIFDKTPAVTPMNLWRYLVLTDYDGPEKPLYERCKKGNLIGYAYRYNTSSSDSSTIGFLNAAESDMNTSNGSMKFVYDFGTHAANGTIRSIYFSETTDVNNRDNRYMFEHKTGIDADLVLEERDLLFGYYVLSDVNIFEQGCRCFLGCKDKKLYFVAYNEHMQEVIEIQELKFPATELRRCVISKMSVGKNFNGDYIVGFIRGYIKFDSNGEYVDIISGDFYAPTGSGYVYNMKDNCFTYVSTKYNKAFYIFTDSSTSSSCQLYIYDTLSDTRLTSYNISQRRHMFGYPIVEEVDIDNIIIHGEKTSLNGTRATSYNYLLSGTSRTAVTNPVIEEQVNDLLIKEIEGFEHIFNPIHFVFKATGDAATRNLLPEPIEKTSDYTMKITYELRFE